MPAYTIPIPVVKLVTLLAPLVSLTTSATILSFSFLQAPILREVAKDDPVTALRHIRWYFETGKFIFPQLSMVSGTLFSMLAYAQPARRPGYIAAAVGCLSILPFTSLYMIPTVNNRILELDDRAKQSKTTEIEQRKEEVSELMERFKQQNLVRGGMYWIGGAIGLYTALF